MQTITVSPSLRRLLLDCATNCTVDCCKALAFDLTGPRLAQWLYSETNVSTDDLKAEIEELLESGSQISTNHIKFDVRDMYSTWRTTEFLNFIQEFLAALKETTQGEGPSYAAAVKLGLCPRD